MTTGDEAEAYLLGVELGKELGASLEAWFAAECIPRVKKLAAAGVSPTLIGQTIGGLLRDAADTVEARSQRP